MLGNIPNILDHFPSFIQPIMPVLKQELCVSSIINIFFCNCNSSVNLSFYRSRITWLQTGRSLDSPEAQRLSISHKVFGRMPDASDLKSLLAFDNTVQFSIGEW